MPWDKALRKVAIEEWLKSGRSAIKARRSLQRQLQLPPNRLPSSRLISYWGNKCWLNKGVVDGNLHCVRKKKVKTVATDEACLAVNQVIYEKRTTRQVCSIRAITADVNAQHVEISKSVVHQVARNVLKMKPYKQRKGQWLKREDYADRLRRCSEFLGLGYATQLLSSIVFSDECVFSLDGFVANNNVYWWATGRDDIPEQQQVRQKQVHAQSVHVWVALNSTFGVSEPFFFNGAINQASYIDCIQNHFFPFLLNRNLNSHLLRFQQDGARCHTTIAVMNFLNQHFLEVIGNRRQAGEPPTWPARSPDLAPNDYWLWGRMVQLVYPPSNPVPANLQDLKARITAAAAAAITLQETETALNSWCTRLRQCIEVNGGHFEYRR